MAVRDIEAFLRERAAAFDSTIDLSLGSPFDVQVIQPMARRLGTDPFSVDLTTFITTRLRQAYPDMATDEGDALTDLLVKANTLLWDPIVREVTKVKRNLSFADPASLTIEEAEALGANLYSERNTGDYARGKGRIYFNQPQNITVSPVNYCTSGGGLRFFPTEAQTIRTEEMLVNQDSDGTYYFDINLIAEEPGDAYNITAGELISIANIEAAVRVRNLRRFRDGDDEDNAEEYVDKARGELSERSLVTLRGIAAKTTNAFPEVRRLNVVGFNDPEMQRDIITGGGLGSLQASGIAGAATDDGENQAATRRFTTAEADFVTLVGSATLVPEGFVLTLFNATEEPSDPIAQDFDITRVVSSTEVEIADQVIGRGKTGLVWTLRKSELTLSNIPGGILFPDSAQGTVDIPDGSIHIGGATDIHLKESSFAESTLVLDNVTDDVTEVTGTAAVPQNPNMPELPSQSPTTYVGFELTALETGTDYPINGTLFRFLESAGRHGLTLQIVSGTNPDNIRVYQIVKTIQDNGSNVQLVTNPAPPILDDENYTWRIYDQVNIDLVNPKETRVTDDDLTTMQGSDVVGTGASTDFQELGVSEDDILEIFDGPDEGVFTVVEPPLFSGTALRLDRNLTSTNSNLSYIVYRANAEGGVERPFIRVKEIELLDSSNQPVGTVVPYAKPVDIQSRAFQNPARGVKHEFVDAKLGIISQQADASIFSFPIAATMTIKVLFADGTFAEEAAALSGDMSVEATKAALNAAITIASNGVQDAVFEIGTGGNRRLGIRPVGVGIVIQEASPVETMTGLFGTNEPRTSADIRVESVPDWDELRPIVDYNSGLDLIQVIDGNQVGFYHAPYSGPDSSVGGLWYGDSGLPAASSALIVRNVGMVWDENTVQFAPETGVQIQLGSRSLGSVRCYFLGPTSIEFDKYSRFSIETEDEGTLRFLPDPTLSTQKIPALPSGTKPIDGSATNGSALFTSAGQDFLRSGIRSGDELVIDYMPLAGDIPLDPVVSSVAGTLAKTLIFSIDSGADISVTFVRDDSSLAEDEVTRDGIVDQINNKAGTAIVSLTGDNRLEFEADAKIIIRSGGSANDEILDRVYEYTGDDPAFSDEDKDNVSVYAGTYTIESVDENVLTLDESLSPIVAGYLDPLLRQGFKVFRPGMQRISTTEMALNEAESDLYYFDVELVSEGSGDAWNIDDSQQLTVENYRSDGYYMTTEDENLAFSVVERIHLVISKTILENGVDDDPVNATQIVGQNLQVLYEHSPLVGDTQNFISSETERVVNESPLSRHLIPHFVRFDMTYVGGSKEEVVVTDVEKYIREIYPAEALEVSDLQNIVYNKGANSIENPIDLIAIVYNVDRTVWAARSQNRLSTGRLAAFIPDVLNIVRDTT